VKSAARFVSGTPNPLLFARWHDARPKASNRKMQRLPKYAVKERSRMLVLCYGMQKSGSTLAFELTCGILTSAGFAQDFIRNDLHDPDPESGKTPRNYIEHIDEESIREFIDIIGPNRRIAIKTHATFPDDLFSFLEKKQADRSLQVVASYRDPRDICLSLLDAGEKSRRTGKGAFGDFETLDGVTDYVKGRIARFRKWASLHGSLRLNYDTVAYKPNDAIDALETALNVKSDRAQVLKHTFDEAFTHKNKAKRNRHQSELTPAQTKKLTTEFRRFIKRACEEDDQSWYEKCRDNILAGVPLD
jgi:hypothetical protein